MFSAAAWVLFVVACVVLAFRRHPIWGLMFYLGTFYVHPPSRWWSYMLPDPRWALLSALITVAAVVLHRGRLRSDRPVWLANAPALLFIAYATWMMMQIPWALDLDSHIEGAIKLVKYMVAFWFIYRLMDTKESLKVLMYAHSIGCALLGLFALGAPRDAGRLEGVGGPGIDDANTLGMFLATGAIVCLGLMMIEKGWRRWVCLLLLACIGNGFVLANSRGAFLGMVIGGGVVMLCKSKLHRKAFWGLALVGLIGFAFAVDKLFVERMFTIGDVAEQTEEADMSARSRVVIYEAQLQMWLEHPLGAGYRGTVVLSPQYLERKWLTTDVSGDETTAGRASHNTFMTTLVEQGLPGAVIFTSLVLWLVTRMRTIRRLDRLGADPELTTAASALCGGVMVVIVAGIAADYLMAEVQIWLFAALVSALQLMTESARRGEPASAAAPLGAAVSSRAGLPAASLPPGVN